MDLESKKKKIIEWVEGLEDQEIIDSLEKLSEQGWWDELSEFEKSEIEKAQKEYEDGLGIPDQEARKIISRKLDS